MVSRNVDLIDLHVHCYSGLGLFSVDAADIGLKTGVTTLIDAGSAGCLNYGPFHNLHDRGRLAPDMLADIALLRMVEGEFDLVDTEGDVRTAAQRLEHAGTVDT